MVYTVGKYTYVSPLEGFEDAPPLPDEKNEDGKSYKNPMKDTLSKSYLEFPDPLDKGRRGVPELRIYRLWDKPIGPHPVAMFEVNLFTPAQFGAFIPWLAIYRGPLSVLIHPNTVEDGEGVEHRNHSQRAIWMGERFPLDLDKL
ncbi:hypothetical protein Daesc_002149 [Daldinia eschscholtzii]|uniref:Dopa 4,5-dioxygenase n=1 Tax=Daldinia eschscholtzii TaxID=292717 RepID=A0AAX6MWU1_9PEZI